MRQGVDCLRGFQFKFTISLSYPLHPALRALRMRTMPHSLLARIMKRPPHMFSFVIKILDNSIKTLQQQKQQQYQYQVKQPPLMPHCSISAISLAAGLSGTQASQTGLCGDQPCTGVMTVHDTSTYISLLPRVTIIGGQASTMSPHQRPHQGKCAQNMAYAQFNRDPGIRRIHNLYLRLRFNDDKYFGILYIKTVILVKDIHT